MAIWRQQWHEFEALTAESVIFSSPLALNCNADWCIWKNLSQYSLNVGIRTHFLRLLQYSQLLNINLFMGHFSSFLFKKILTLLWTAYLAWNKHFITGLQSWKLAYSHIVWCLMVGKNLLYIVLNAYIHNVTANWAHYWSATECLSHCSMLWTKA